MPLGFLEIPIGEAPFAILLSFLPFLFLIDETNRLGSMIGSIAIYPVNFAELLAVLMNVALQVGLVRI